MTEIDMTLPPYVYRQMSNGRWRLRFEKRGLPKRWFKARVGTDAFRREYAEYLSGRGREVRVAPAAPGSIAAMVRLYERSAAFGELNPATRAQRSAFFRVLVDQAPDAAAAALTPRKVRELRDNRSATPSAANNMVKCIGYLYRWGIEAGLVDRNPADGVASLKPKRKGGYPPWTAADVAAHRKAHPAGSKAHLALCLFLFTGCRISDALVLGPDHVRDGWITWAQGKGGGEVSVPILPQLQAAIDAYDPPVLGLRAPFLATVHGRRHSTPKALANWLARTYAAAGIEGKSSHGIRKTLGGLLADLGCSEHEIMAVLGHTNPRTSAIYTQSAQRRRLAESAITKMRRWKW